MGTTVNSIGAVRSCTPMHFKQSVST